MSPCLRVVFAIVVPLFPSVAMAQYGTDTYDSDPYGLNPGGVGVPAGQGGYGRSPIRPAENQPAYRYIKYCTSCNEPVPDSAMVGERCPHCGILWVPVSTSQPVTRQSNGSGVSAASPGLSAQQSMLLLKFAVVLAALMLAGISYVFRRTTRSPVQQVMAGRSMMYSPWELAQAQGARTQPDSSGLDVPGPRRPPPFRSSQPPQRGTTHSVTQLRKKFRPEL